MVSPKITSCRSPAGQKNRPGKIPACARKRFGTWPLAGCRNQENLFRPNSMPLACDLAEKHWQKARTACGTRDWMFRNLQVLTARFVFDDWKRLMQVLAGEVEIPP